MTSEQEEVLQLKWALAVLALWYLENTSEATVVLPSKALGVFSDYDVTLEVSKDSTVVHVKVIR